MKKLQQFFAPITFTLLLSVSASAGIMSPMENPPPPPPPAANATAQSDGFMSTGFTATDPVTIAVLSVLQSVLARF